MKKQKGMKYRSNLPDELENSLRQRVGMGGTFPVPEGYFESFNERLKSRMSESTDRKPHSHKQIYLLGGFAAAAAVLVGVLFLSQPTVNTIKVNDNQDYTYHDHLAESYYSYLVYTTSERNLINTIDSGNPSRNPIIPFERSNSNENLDPGEIVDYLYYNNGNVYSIMDWQ
ncbi:MAG: hypothetical protein HPY80_06600 [Bacteroidales bacterium]|nr:hypothetical protein [Bacteroidales bacterium]